MPSSSSIPEVWFAIPSANPENCRRTLPAWRERGYRIAILQNRTRADIPADIIAWSDTYPGWAASINILCRDIVPKSAPIIVSGGDDMLPDPHHSAAELAEQFRAHFPDRFGIMQPTGDGYLGAAHFCGSPWFGRGWIERAYGGRGPMPPGPPAYFHNWADNELYWVARGLGVLWERPDLTQEHRHFSRTGESRPDYWTDNVERPDREDVQLFIARLWQRFPGSEPLGGTHAFDPNVLHHYRRQAEAYWLSRYAEDLIRPDADRRLRTALAECARRGDRRIAIFGAGAHTRQAAGALAAPPTPVEIVCLIDDHAERRGGKLWGFPVVSVAEAASLDLDAVILSSTTMEAALARSTEPLRSRGVRVIPLYTPPSTALPTPKAAGQPALASDR